MLVRTKTTTRYTNRFTIQYPVISRYWMGKIHLLLGCGTFHDVFWYRLLRKRVRHCRLRTKTSYFAIGLIHPTTSNTTTTAADNPRRITSGCFTNKKVTKDQTSFEQVATLSATNIVYRLPYLFLLFFYVVFSVGLSLINQFVRSVFREWLKFRLI